MSPADAAIGDWLAGARRRLADVELAPDVASVGRVLAVADGVARVGGLPDAVLDERLVLEGGRPALVRGLDVDALTAVLLDDPDGVEAGQRVRATRGMLDVPVGEALLGRVVDPLGRPLDGGPPIDAEGRGPRLPIERAPPPIVDRAPVTTPVHTGVLVVDALLALGRGQRELVVGDRATGKSALALDVLASQRERDVVGVYVAIGQRASAVERAIASLREHGAFERCIVVAAGPSSPAGLRWIAPFAATSMAEHVRDAGGHALVVYDDLSRHAAVHRELALLGDEAPGREAYPGDVFHLHARLLERAACLGAEAGGGSLTALPIAETDAGDLAGYIPTNLVSITDGQIVLDAHRFAAGQRPAVDVGRSVSRIGGKAQGATMRRLAGRLRLDYAQFLELEAFTRFGGLVDERTRTRVARGRCIRALLSQPRFSPLDEVEEIALLAALSAGALDALPPAAVPTLRTRLREALRGAATSAPRPREPGAYDDEHLDALVRAVRALVDGIGGAAASPAEGHP